MMTKPIIKEIKQKIYNLQENYSNSEYAIFESKYSDVSKFSLGTHMWRNVTNNNDAEYSMIVDRMINEESSSLIIHGNKNCKIDQHSHKQEELCILLTGKIEIIHLGISKILKPIDFLHIKPHEIHSVKFLEESQLFVTWSPKL